MISKDRVRSLIASYGANPDAFPVEEQAAARRLIATDPELQTELQEAQDLDALLGLSEVVAPSADLRRQIAEIPVRHPLPNPGPQGLLDWTWLRFSLARMVGAALLSAALGVGSGLLAGQPPEDSSTAATDDLDSWAEFATLTFSNDLTLDEFTNEDGSASDGEAL